MPSTSDLGGWSPFFGRGGGLPASNACARSSAVSYHAVHSREVICAERKEERLCIKTIDCEEVKNTADKKSVMLRHECAAILTIEEPAYRSLQQLARTLLVASTVLPGNIM